MGLEALVSGLFGGAGVLLLWEIVLRPMRQGRALAEVLSAEVSINLELLVALQAVGQRRSAIPPDLRFSTTVYDNLMGQLGDLPPDLVRDVVFLYRYFSELNAQPPAYVASVREMRKCAPGSAEYRSIDQEIRMQIVIFNDYVGKAIARIELIQPLGLKAAAPWWSIRGYRRPPSISLNQADLKQRVDATLRRRQADAENLDPQ
jgi:hypothetical protein